MYFAKRKTSIKRIGILTAGGDCPGLNAVLRAAVKRATSVYGIEVIGFLDGYYGLMENQFIELDFDRVSGILTQGGTILGTSNKADPFRYPTGERDEQGRKVMADLSERALQVFKKNKLQALICLGGDGTLIMANKLLKIGLPTVGVPKTIDNDVMETDVTFGFDSAVAIATEAIDRIHTTAQSHHRVMIVETMGRYVGWLALFSGVASGGDIILLPEMPYKIDKICDFIKWRKSTGRRFHILVVSEGTKPEAGEIVVKRQVYDSTDSVRLGGVGNLVAAQIEETLDLETRVTSLGHLQRGGTPTAFDRILATRYGGHALDLVAEEKFGHMPAYKGGQIVPVTLEAATRDIKRVPLNHPLIDIAKSTGTCFGV